jgi:predicted RNA-binding protein YlxR (DUF448 family)
MTTPMLARTQQDMPDAGPRNVSRGTERACAVTGTVKPVDEMIRFVLAPDGTPVADLKRRLPGRGIWITATRNALQTAIARKAFSRGFKRDVRVAPDLAEATERMLEQATLDALAIVQKAGKVAIGFGKVEAALAGGEAAAVLHAADAAPDGVRKLEAVRRRADDGAGKIPVIERFTAAQLDLALGRSNVVHAALLAGRETKAFLARFARLERFSAEADGRGGPRRQARGS